VCFSVRCVVWCYACAFGVVSRFGWYLGLCSAGFCCFVSDCFISMGDRFVIAVCGFLGFGFWI